MKRNTKSRGGGSPPRVYDKRTGEYRPVSRSNESGRQENQGGKYATPQRRAEIKRRRRRRILLIFYIVTFIAVISAAVVLSLTVLFKIDTIQVSGKSRYTAEEIVKACGIQKGENLFLADVKDAASSIERTLPYIGSAKVTRGLPAKINIDVQEETVSGVIEHQGKYVVVSAGGKVLELADKVPENCPSVKGLELTKAEVGKSIVYKDTSREQMFKELLTAIKDNKLEKITAIDLSVPSKILVVYDKRVTMNLGLPSDFEYKIRFAKSILDEGKIKDSEKGTLNLSVAAEDNNAFFNPDYTISSKSSGVSSQNSSKSSQNSSK
jgi:cell division protein FtsQ